LQQQQRQLLQAGAAGIKKVVQVSAGSLALNADDTLQIATLVCSTKLTHNGKHLGVLQCRCFVCPLTKLEGSLNLTAPLSDDVVLLESTATAALGNKIIVSFVWVTEAHAACKPMSLPPILYTTSEL